MKILITGSKGFIGRNLIKLFSIDSTVEEIMEYDKNNIIEELQEYCTKCDAVFHLAAVLRPENLSGFDDNIDLTSKLLNYLKHAGNKCPIMFASSIQAELDNPYGHCKRIEEAKILEYGKENNVNTYVFRFPNLFGPMSRPNYTSVVATFCYNTVKGVPITINNPAVQMKFAFVDSVLEYVYKIVKNNDDEKSNRINIFENYYPVGLGELSYYMETLKRKVKPAIERNDDFYEKLEQTYQWYDKNVDKII